MPRPHNRCGGADVVVVLTAASVQYGSSTGAQQARITRSAVFRETLAHHDSTESGQSRDDELYPIQ
jgi:hypothetical protein